MYVLVGDFKFPVFDFVYLYNKQDFFKTSKKLWKTSPRRHFSALLKAESKVERALGRKMWKPLF